MADQENTLIDLRKSFVMVVAIWATIFASLVVYFFMAKILLPADSAALTVARYPVDRLRMMFYALSLGIFGVCLFIRRMGLSPADVALSHAIKKQKLIVTNILTFALCESPAIAGLALAFISRSALDFVPFGVIAAVMLTIFFPRFSQWEAWYRNPEQS